MIRVEDSLQRLEKYCRRNEFKGWDPYDGLNSKVFKALPIVNNIDVVRLAWIQIFKRNPINLRRVFLVPKGQNPKGIALMLSGYCNIFRYQQTSHSGKFENEKNILLVINSLADLLISLRSPVFSNVSAWGYDFDWKSKAFFLPKGTPTIVATSFAVDALLKAYEITKDETYLSKALASSSFILNDLNRIPKPNGLMFSYSPLDHRAVYNATLLATRTLSRIYKYTTDIECKELAYLSAKAVCDLQNEDGSFPHSDQVGNAWRDNFHTGFKLESLATYQKDCFDKSFELNIERGFKYWYDNFFDHQTGIAYYYDNNHSLIDLHCAAQATPTIYALDKFKEYERFLSLVLEWTIMNLQDDSGYFYFQKKGHRINRIPYLRWPNTWMFYGMSYYLLATVENEEYSRIN